MFRTGRRRLVGLFVIALVSGARGQDSLSYGLGISAGMGITVIHATDVVDYINATAPSASRLDDFASAAEFFGTVEQRVDESWGLKAEYAYLINSYGVAGTLGAYEYFYAVHMPTVLVQFLDVHRGYAFKFGGGAGYHVARFSERQQGAGERKFASSGVGLKFEAEGNTALGERLFAYLAGDVRTNVMGVFTDAQGSTLRARSASPKDARMNFFSLGLKFGIIWYL